MMGMFTREVLEGTSDEDVPLSTVVVFFSVFLVIVLATYLLLLKQEHKYQSQSQDYQSNYYNEKYSFLENQEFTVGQMWYLFYCKWLLTKVILHFLVKKLRVKLSQISLFFVFDITLKVLGLPNPLLLLLINIFFYARDLTNDWFLSVDLNWSIVERVLLFIVAPHPNYVFLI